MNMSALHTLLIDPHEDGAALLERELVRDGQPLLSNLRITLASDPAAAADRLEAGSPDFDVIIARERGGGKLWLQQCIMLGEGGLPVLCIVTDDAQGEQVIKLGAHDFFNSKNGGARRLAHLISRAAEHSYMQRQIRYLETEVQSSDERFRSVILPSVDGALLIDTDGIIQFANGAAQGIFGKSLTDLLGTKFEFPIVAHQVVEISKAHVPDEDVVVEVRSLETVWERRPAYLVSLRDITAQARTDLALRRISGANNRLLKAFNTLNTGVVITDPNLPNNPMIYVNPACVSLTGFTQEEILGNSISLFHGAETDPVISGHIQTSIDEQRSFHGIVLHYRKNGDKFWDELVLNPVFDENGTLTNFIALMDDVTDRVQAMEQLHHRRRIEGLVTSTSSEFVNLPPDQIDEAIERTLQRLGRFIGAERCTVMQFVSLEDAAGTVHISHEWVDEGVPSLLERSQTQTLYNLNTAPWLYAQMKRLESVQFSNIEQLPTQASREKQVLRSQNVKSMLTVPMSSDNVLVGYLGFATFKHERSWSDADIALLKVIGEIIFGTINRARTEQALRESEERLRTVVAKTPMIILSFDAAGTITFAQGQALGSIGRQSAPLIGQSIFAMVEGMAEASANFQRVLQGETFLGTMNFPDNPELVFETWYTPILSGGDIVGANAVAIDITERYRAQSAEREQRALAEALRDTASALTSSLDPDDVMQMILENVHRVVPHDAASIVLNGYPDCIIAYTRGRMSSLMNADTQWAGDKPPTHLPSDLKIFNYMRSTGKALLVPNTADYDGWVNLPQLSWINSYLGVPIQLQSSGDTIGFLNLDSAAPNFFTETHVESLQAFADQAAVAIQNAQLYAQLRRDAQQLFMLNRATSFLFTALAETSDVEALCHQIAEAIVHEFGKVDCSVVLIEEYENARELRRVSRAGQYQAHTNGESLEVIEQVIASGELFYQPTVDGTLDDSRTRSRFIVPLKASGYVIGVLDVRSLEADAFDPQEQKMLEGFSGRAAMTIENARLYKRIRSYADVLEARVRERTLDLQRERERLNTILNSMDEAVIAWEARDVNANPTINYVNGAFLEMFGYNAEQVIGVQDFYHRLTASLAERDRLMRTVQEGTRATEFVRTETILVRADRTKFDALITATRFRESAEPDSTGAGTHIAGVLLIRDIRQEKALQEQKDRFIANASHELRTPLANLKLRLYLLKHQPDKVTEHITIIEQVTQRMQDLVEDLLDHTRFERGMADLKREEQRLQDLVEAVLQLQSAHAEEKQIELRAQMPSRAVFASVDRSRLLQVITNLVVNAINYTPSGGTVTVKLDTTTSDDHEQTLALLRIQDSGIGIPADIQDQIFKPFYRANDGTTRGTGLGLTIAREIVALHGGSIHLESVENVGTTFTVALPLHQPEVAAIG